MNLSYKVKDKNIYLVCELDSDSMIDNFSFGMLKDNSVPGLIPFESVEGRLVYNISSKTTLERILAKATDEKDIIGIVQGIVDTMCTLSEYMVDEKSVLLDNEYIYVDLKENRADLICIPLLNKTFNGGVDKYLIQLLETVYNKHPEYSLVEYLIYQFKNNTTTTIEQIKNILYANQKQQNTVKIKSQIEVERETIKEVKPQKEIVQQPVKEVKQQEEVVQQPIKEIERRGEVVQQLVKEIERQEEVVQQPIKEVKQQEEVVQQSIKEIKPQTVYEHQWSTQPSSQEEFIQQPYAQVKPSMEEVHMSQVDELQKQQVVQQHLSTEVKPQQMVQKTEFYTQYNQNQQFNVQNAQVDIEQQSGMKKKMSLYYLLTHYSEENKRKYKEQKNHTSTESVQQNTDFNVQNVSTNQSQQNIKQERSENEIKSERIIAKQILPNVQDNMELNYGDTMVLNESAATDSGETTILSDMVINTTVPYIIRTRTSERISILKSPFRIGKENSSVDYFIADNTAISRNHAQIISENGRYYVIDNGSKNHTYVNGKMIPAESKVEIFPGNKIYFANEEFTFFII